MRRISGRKLAELRGRRTQTDLASALRARGFGTTQTTVSRWEAGQQPQAAVLPFLADELGVRVSDLCSDDDEEESALPAHRDLGEMLYEIAEAYSAYQRKKNGALPAPHLAEWRP